MNKIEKIAKYYGWNVNTLYDVIFVSEAFKGKDLLEKLENSMVVFKKG